MTLFHQKYKVLGVVGVRGWGFGDQGKTFYKEKCRTFLVTELGVSPFFSLKYGIFAPFFSPWRRPCRPRGRTPNSVTQNGFPRPNENLDENIKVQYIFKNTLNSRTKK